MDLDQNNLQILKNYSFFFRCSRCTSVVIFLSLFNCISTQESEVRAKEELAANTIDLQNDSVKVKKLLSEGDELFHKNKFEAAVEKFQKANSIKPTEDGYYLLGLSFLKLEMAGKAKEVLSRGLELNPKNEKILSTYALVLTTLGDEDNSVLTYGTLQKNFPSNDLYAFKYGIGLKSLLKYEESYRVLKGIKEENFHLKSQLYMHLGDICFLLKKFSLSEEYYVKAKSVDNNLDIKESKARVKFAAAEEKGDEFFIKKNYTEAIRYYSSLLDIKPESGIVLYKLGKTYFFNNQLDKAEENFINSLRQENKNRETYLLLSSIYSRKGNYQKSIKVLQEAILIFPNDSELYQKLGLSYKRLGNKKLALVSLIDSKYKNPNHTPSRNSLIEILLEENLLLEARTELEELSEITPKDEKNKRILAKLNRLGEDKNSFQKKETPKNLEKSLNEKNNKQKSSKIITVYNSYYNSGQKEKCLLFLKKVWKEEAEADNLDTLEVIGSLFSKLGHNSLAIESFEWILKKKPESYTSYYQLGLLYLPTDRILALQNFEKAIVIKRDDPSFYIARGINYYKLGKRERAREDFHYALSIESNLEIASYNLGMILYNDHLYEDAQTVFLDLTKKYPNFADPYYHLSYIYFEQNRLEEAEKYIVSSLNLDRNPTTIFAYIKILEELKKKNQKTDKYDTLLFSLKKEIIEKYPNSTYVNKVSDSVLNQKENQVLIQNYPLSDKIVSSPIFVNGTIILNYGTSIVRVASDTKNILWRTETNSPYQLVKVATRLYGISKTHLDQIDMETGKNIWKIQVDTNLTGKLELGESILFSGIRAGKETIYSYSFDGELQSTLLLETGSKWAVTQNGNVYIFRDTLDGMDWNIVNSNLNNLVKSQTLLGSDKGEISIIGVSQSNCYLQKGKQVYKFEANGNFFRSPKLENDPLDIYLKNDTLYLKTDRGIYSFLPNLSKLEKSEINENNTQFTNKNNIYVSANGILTMKDNFGKIVFSENISEKAGKSKLSVFSVLLKNEK